MKHLYRSKQNRVFAGVVGGIGEYFDIDPTLLRVIWILILIFTGFFPGLIAYILAAIIIPEAPRDDIGAKRVDAE
jgi:phage shock protein C